MYICYVCNMRGHIFSKHRTYNFEIKLKECMSAHRRTTCEQHILYISSNTTLRSIRRARYQQLALRLVHVAALRFGYGLAPSVRLALQGLVVWVQLMVRHKGEGVARSACKPFAIQAACFTSSVGALFAYRSRCSGARAPACRGSL